MRTDALQRLARATVLRNLHNLICAVLVAASLGGTAAHAQVPDWKVLFDRGVERYQRGDLPGTIEIFTRYIEIAGGDPAGATADAAPVDPLGG